MRKAIFAFLICMMFVPALYAAENLVYTRDVAYDDEKLVKVELDFGLGQISMARGQGDYVARIHGDYDADKFKVDVNYEKKGGVGHLVVKVDKKNKLFDFGSDEDTENSWQILLGDMVPLELIVDAGMAETNFNFTGLSVENLSMDIGMASGTMMFNQPNPVRMNQMILDLGQSSMNIYGLGNANFRELNVDCGMSSVELDFSGQVDFDALVTLEMGMSSTEIVLNPNAGVQIDHDAGLTSSVDLPGSFREVSKGVYQSANYQKARGHFDFEIDVGMGSVDFRLAKSL